MDVFRALADPTRRQLLVRLASEPSRVADLASEHAMTRPAVSKHLRILSEAGLVSATSRGRERLYALRAEPLAPVQPLIDLLKPGAIQGTPPISAEAVERLDLEVRRTVRDHRLTGRPTTPARTRHAREDTA